MTTVNSEIVSYKHAKDLKELLSSPGPCLSVYLPLSAGNDKAPALTAKENGLRWKEVLGTLEGGFALRGPGAHEFVQSIAKWEDVAAEATGKSGQGRSIAVFRSNDTYRIVFPDSEVNAKAVLGPHFHIRPLLPQLTGDQNFYLLALSQNDTRLLYCTAHTSEAIAFSKHTQGNFETWMNQAKPDHRAVNNAVSASAGGGGAGHPSALAPKGSDREAKDEYLSHFFKQISDGVAEVLKGKNEPLVVCAVKAELPLYREVNKYPHLSTAEVHGAPNGLKSGEMHARALEALRGTYAGKVDAVLADWNHRVGSGASSREADVVKAAHDGRVLSLLVSDSAETRGAFDEATNSVKSGAKESLGSEDLVNDAAVQTILHAGDVFVVPQEKMPEGSPVAAVFRY